ncbi:MAG TPA: FKBP-type peptidyl-prolyl cis-trans isomerase [Candidatus Saccharimonadales bacterium]|nr:FKBP-type peptidyl-prolyl cis-trans isomerase [Candidatus Saccharimonadales bacterium]
MRSKARRAGWLFLTALFVFTAIGLGVWAFWADTHPSKQNQDNNSQNASASCTFSANTPAKTLPAPAAYKPGPSSKLQITDLTKGSGRTVQAGDCLTVKYYGTLADNGTVFDQDFSSPLALQFPVGTGQVIPGWDEGLIGMKVGGMRRLVIPPSLAYGSQAQGAIPPNSTLVFWVKLISIK